MVRIVLPPVAVYAARLMLALIACAVLDATLPHDSYYTGWRIGFAALVFVNVAVFGLSDLMARQRRREPGVIDARTIIRSRNLWGALATIAALAFLASRTESPLRRTLLGNLWCLVPLCLAGVGRRSYWDPIPPFAPMPRDERSATP